MVEKKRNDYFFLNKIVLYKYVMLCFEMRVPTVNFFT